MSFSVNAWAEWLPDPLSWSGSRRRSAEDVPAVLGWLSARRRNGRLVAIPVLSPAVRRRLTEAFQAMPAAAVSAGVFGYRSDVSSQRVEQREVARFNRATHLLAQHYPWVVATDVRECFASISVGGMAGVAADLGGGRVAQLLMALEADGVRTLPPDYVEFRFLSNVFLRELDSVLQTPFTRYADDYRVFAPTEPAAYEALAALDEKAAAMGLRLHPEKTRVLPTAAMPRAVHDLSFKPKARSMPLSNRARVGEIERRVSVAVPRSSTAEVAEALAAALRLSVQFSRREKARLESWAEATGVPLLEDMAASLCTCADTVRLRRPPVRGRRASEAGLPSSAAA